MVHESPGELPVRMLSSGHIHGNVRVYEDLQTFSGASWSSVYTRRFVSKKLRTLMQLVPVKAPPAGSSPSGDGKLLELGDVPIRVTPPN